MTWLMLAFLVALAVLGPLFGADTRDGLSWTRDHFWLPRRTQVRTADSPARTSSDRAAAERHRTAPACG
jgi:hypothetical protein